MKQLRGRGRNCSLAPIIPREATLAPQPIQHVSSDVINYDIVLQLATTPSPPPLDSRSVRLPLRLFLFFFFFFPFFFYPFQNPRPADRHTFPSCFSSLSPFFSLIRSRRINRDSLNHAPAFSPATLDRSVPDVSRFGQTN